MKRLFAGQILAILIVLLGSGTAWCGMGWGGGGGHGGGGGGGGMTGSSLSTFTTADFSGSGVCAGCHDRLTDSTGADVSIAAHWCSTMMANAAKDPLWQAKMSTEVVRNPALSQAIQEKCSRCHTPMASAQARASGQTVSLLNSGFLNTGHALHSAAMDGVSCTLCHQIQDVGLGEAESFSGHYYIDTSTSSPYRLIFGQFAQPFANPMMMHSGFQPVQGAHAGDSAVCGTCHTLYTPARDAAGNFTQEFPEQMTYPEWEHAVRGGGVSKSCGGCHMPAAAGGAALSTMPWWLSARSPFALHHFAGANNFMLGLLKTNSAALGMTATAAQMDATISRTTRLLNSDSAVLSFSGAGIAGNVLGISLNIGNKVGHKFPSGVPFRRAWIHFTVKDAAGATFFESGKPLADGSIAGCDADASAAAFEPHYDLITSPAEVQVYESIMGDLTGAVTYTLLEGVSYRKDNRLLPPGFSKATASENIAVAGEANSDSNFAGGQDTVRYQVNTTGRVKPFVVKATLYYQAISFAAVRDLRLTNTTQVQTFNGMYNAASKLPVAVTSAQSTVR